MGVALTAADEGVHEIGPADNWNESRYVDFWDAEQRVGGWLRIGMRPNEKRAEMSVCVYLSDGRVAFRFDRPAIDDNGFGAGGQDWRVDDPYVRNRVAYNGPVHVLDDGWRLTDPRSAYATSEEVDCRIDLTVTSRGLPAVMGADQDHIDRIFLPGQADFHYQHLAWTTGTIRVADHTWTVAGQGGKDHSWGPRNWHAKTYFRWHTGVVDEGTGFMLVRAVGPTKETRSGHVWEDGRFYLVDDFDMRNEYAGPPHHELRRVHLAISSGDRTWVTRGTPQAWLPLRHRQPGPNGAEALLRIVKSPTEWVWADGRIGSGACEYHDLMVDGRPIGLHD
jgi:hypothetical protein